MQLSTNTKINQIKVAILAEQHVLQLQIPVHYILRVQVAEAHRELHDIDLDPLLGESLDLAQMGLQLAALNETHDEIEADVGLETFVNVDNEWIL